MLIFRQLRIRNYRNLGNVDLTFEAPEPGKHASYVIVGGQSSGKTSIMAALAALFDKGQNPYTSSQERDYSLELAFSDFGKLASFEIAFEFAGHGEFEIRLELEAEENAHNPKWPSPRRVWHCTGPRGHVVGKNKFPLSTLKDNLISYRGDAEHTVDSLRKVYHMVSVWLPTPLNTQWESLIRTSGPAAARSPLQNGILSKYFGMEAFLERQEKGHDLYCVLRKGDISTTTGVSRREMNFVHLLITTLGDHRYNSYNDRSQGVLLLDDLVDHFGPQALPLLHGLFPFTTIIATQADWQAHPLLQGTLEAPQEDDPMSIWRGTLRRVGSWDQVDPYPEPATKKKAVLSPVQKNAQEIEDDSEDDSEDCLPVDDEEGDLGEAGTEEDPA